MNTRTAGSVSLPERRLAERLERGEVVHYPVCPFTLPSGEAHRFLLEQRLASRAYKNIGYDPINGQVTGFASGPASQGERLQTILADFSQTVTHWLRRPCRVMPKVGSSIG